MKQMKGYKIFLLECKKKGMTRREAAKSLAARYRLKVNSAKTYIYSWFTSDDWEPERRGRRPETEKRRVSRRKTARASVQPVTKLSIPKNLGGFEW